MKHKYNAGTKADLVTTRTVSYRLSIAVFCQIKQLRSKSNIEERSLWCSSKSTPNFAINCEFESC